MTQNIDRIITRYNAVIRQTRLNGCRGFTTKHKNGYVIMLNSALSTEEQARTTLHELCHIVLGHLDDREYLPDIVKEKEASEMMEEFFD